MSRELGATGALRTVPNLTTRQLRRAAREARKLAYDYAEDRGPELLDWTWCACAAGRVVERAELPENTGGWLEYTAEFLDSDAFLPGGTLSAATSAQVNKQSPGAVVFPLLALADALENAAIAAPKSTP